MPGEKQSFSAPKGTSDLLPPESLRWVALVRLAMETFARAGFLPVDTPIFEATEVFERGVGETSEVVGKQMYTFEDRGGRSLTLRPEGTAPVMRAVLEHLMIRGALAAPPVKLAYAGPMFRHEQPQKGRMRQFFQVGIEAIGSESPLVDAEAIETGAAFLDALGAETRLLLNSIGHPDASCRGEFQRVLGEFLRAHESALAEIDRERTISNPMRTFDSKERATIEVMKDAPLITDHLCDECRSHFEQVRSLLGELGVPFELDPRLVRGLDYYTRTAFEFKAPSLGAQDTVLAGGRYDGLAESLGGPRLPGIGFASGVDRLMLIPNRLEGALSYDAYVIAAGEGLESEALELTAKLRRRGFSVLLDLQGRSMKSQLKDAVRSAARVAIILGPEEAASGDVTVRDLATATQERISRDELESRLSR
jgi:histidyl-tRNA synthetase